MSQILVWYDKHGETFWDASTDEELASSALEILSIMFRNGWPFFEPDKPVGDPPVMTITEDEVNAMPEGRSREVLQAEFDKQKARMTKYARVMQGYERELIEYNETKRIVEEEDTSVKVWKSRTTGKVVRREPVAWTALRNRTDYEYCRVELETLSKGKVRTNEVSEQRV